MGWGGLGKKVASSQEIAAAERIVGLALAGLALLKAIVEQVS